MIRHEAGWARQLDHETAGDPADGGSARVGGRRRPSVVIASYGFARPVIYRWLREARGKGRGLRALRSWKRDLQAGRAVSRPSKEQQLFRWINGKDPRQHGFDFGLWTRLVVRKLIADKFGANFGVTAVGKLLARLRIDAAEALEACLSAILLQLKLGRSTPYQALPNEAKKARRRDLFLGWIRIPRRCGYGNDMGRQPRTNPDHTRAWSAPVGRRGFRHQ